MKHYVQSQHYANSNRTCSDALTYSVTKVDKFNLKRVLDLMILFQVSGSGIELGTLRAQALKKIFSRKL